MSSLEIGPQLVGQRVCTPTHPEWGVGQVLRVQSTTVDGQPRHRVSVQFASGHRILHVPPACLTAPQPEARRDSGWLDRAAGQDLDARLRGLPDFVHEFLGTPQQRVVMLVALYACEDNSTALVAWARQQTGLADPLAHWSRDELAAAFGEFCRRRDHALRIAADALRRGHGATAVERVLAGVESPLRERMTAALRGSA